MTESYKDIASDWNTWNEYINTSGDMSRAEYDAMTMDERIAMLVACYGEEQ